jgi:methylmalonyl-CoA/ethylmalonyl-CoA epimerase
MSIIKRIDRVAFAVGDLDKAKAFFADVLGAELAPLEDFPEFKFRCQPFKLAGHQMELLAPYDPSSVLSHFLMREHQGFHHLTCEVENLDEAIRALEAKGIGVVSRHRYHEPHEGERWEGAFIDPKHAFGILIQLVQKTRT